MDLSAANVIHLRDRLKADRQTWMSVWQKLTDNVMPMRGDFTSKRSKGSLRHEKIMDQTPTWAAQQTTAALLSMLMPAGRVWAWLRPTDNDLERDDDVMKWVNVASRRMHAVMSSPRAGMLRAAHQVFNDSVVYGTGVEYIGEEASSDWPLRYQARHLAECMLVEDAYGEIEGVIREFELTATQARDFFPDWVLPKAVADKIDDPATMFGFIHAVMPRREGSGALGGEGKPIASVYIFEDGKDVVREGGYDEFPFAISRWAVHTGEVYGRGPAMTALPDIQMLYAQRKSILRANQMAAAPPWLFPDDAMVQPLKMRPNGINFWDATSGEKPVPLMANGRADIGVEELNVSREQITRAFHVDLMRLPDRDRMTATEVMQHRDDAMRVLAPTIGRQETEYLGKKIDRTFAICERAGLFPPPPAALEGEELRVEYDSPLARAARAESVQAIDDMVIALGQFVSLDPNLRHLVDGEAAFRMRSEIRGVPAELLKRGEDVAAAAQQDAQIQQMAQASGLAAANAQTMAQAAGAAKDFAAARQAEGLA